jgi:RNA polymerase sigma-B factor
MTASLEPTARPVRHEVGEPVPSSISLAHHGSSTGSERQQDHAARSDETKEILRRLQCTDDPQAREVLLERLVLVNLGVARTIARRYRGRGPSAEDLEQVARLGLVKAARGFDPTRENDFLAYAVPTIRGEVRKHFRDQGWMVRPPRRIQELQSRIICASNDLTHTLGRSPRPSEIASALDAPVEEVQDALAAEGCFHPSSLDTPVRSKAGTIPLGDLIASPDDAQHAAEVRVILAPAVRQLSERERRILHLRFFKGLTQEEIAQDIGVTQMHVSRLISQILETLRAALTEPEPRPGPPTSQQAS